MAKIKPLRNSPLFSSLTDRELALFSRIVVEEDYIEGTVLVAENMKSDKFYLIERGKIAVTAGGQVGDDRLVLGEGDTLGEWSLLGPPHLTSISARVVEEAQVLVLEKDDFDRFAEEEPVIAVKVIRGLIKGLWPSIMDAKGIMKEILGQG